MAGPGEWGRPGPAVRGGDGTMQPARTCEQGSRPRVGEIDLSVPRKRSGESYFPSFLEPRRPCEQAIVSVVMEDLTSTAYRPERSIGWWKSWASAG